MKKNKTVLQKNNGHNETLLQQFSTRLPKKKKIKIKSKGGRVYITCKNVPGVM